MKKIAAFAGSNNPTSINQQLVTYASSLLNECPSTLINMRDFPMPVFGIGVLEKDGPPEKAFALRALLGEHDGYIISVGEYNRSVSAVFKNTMDWLSMAGEGINVFGKKPVLLLGTSPGSGGAQNAMGHAEAIISELEGKVVNKFSVPSFYQTVLVDEKGFQIKDEDLNLQLHELILNFESRLMQTMSKVQ